MDYVPNVANASVQGITPFTVLNSAIRVQTSDALLQHTTNKVNLNNEHPLLIRSFNAHIGGAPSSCRPPLDLGLLIPPFFSIGVRFIQCSEDLLQR